MLTSDLSFLDSLSPLQEHFLKKHILEEQLASEIHQLSKPHSLQYLGPPFAAEIDPNTELPLLQFFFGHFVETFPLIANNTKEDREEFWRDVVQPFVDSFNTKNISEGAERSDHVTKRHQVNLKLLSSLVLFYNSTLISKRDMEYLEADHLKSADQGKLHKLAKGPAATGVGLEHFQKQKFLDDYAAMVYVQDISVNIVAVDVRTQEEVQRLWNALRVFRRTKPTSTYSFVIQVTRRSGKPGKYKYKSHFVARTYSEFRELEKLLRHKYPGLMTTDVGKLPHKMKNDDGVEEQESERRRKIEKEKQRARESEKLKEKQRRREKEAQRQKQRERARDADASSPSLDDDLFEDARSSLLSGHSPPSNITRSSTAKSGTSHIFPANARSDSCQSAAPSHTFSSHPSRSVSPSSSAPTPKVLYHREKLRLALRGYLHTLLAKPEIAHCDVFTQFLAKAHFSTLSPAQNADYVLRMNLERHRVETQQQFLASTANVVYRLTRDVDVFKQKLVREPKQLSALFQELSAAPDPDSVSPLLRTFVEWCKLEVAATIYQVFLTQDNSSEWLQKCRKFHRVFPYRLCYTVLKYTNPVAVMLRLVDVLFVNVPTLRWGDHRTHNVLSMTFVMLLDEDLDDYTKERARLMAEAPLDDLRFAIMVDRINSYVRNKDLVLSDEIKADARAAGDSLLVALLKSPRLEPKLGAGDLQTLKLVENSCAAYESLDRASQLDKAQTYVNLRQLWQLEVRARDKQLLKQLWQEPELTRLLKKVLTMFFQPMMAVMKQCDVHLAFRDWQRFMDDLMAELGVLDAGDMYYLGAVETFERFKALLDRHEPALWRFLHNLYVKDDQRIFLRIVEWIESFLAMLRRKFTDPELVTLDLAAMSPNEAVDPEKLVSELNERIRLVVEKRRLLQQFLRATGEKKGGEDEEDNWQDGEREREKEVGEVGEVGEREVGGIGEVGETREIGDFQNGIGAGKRGDVKGRQNTQNSTNSQAQCFPIGAGCENDYAHDYELDDARHCERHCSSAHAGNRAREHAKNIDSHADRREEVYKSKKPDLNTAEIGVQTGNTPQPQKETSVPQMENEANVEGIITDRFSQPNSDNHKGPNRDDLELKNTDPPTQKRKDVLYGIRRHSQIGEIQSTAVSRGGVDQSGNDKKVNKAHKTGIDDQMKRQNDKAIIDGEMWRRVNMHPDLDNSCVTNSIRSEHADQNGDNVAYTQDTDTHQTLNIFSDLNKGDTNAEGSAERECTNVDSPSIGARKSRAGLATGVVEVQWECRDCGDRDLSSRESISKEMKFKRDTLDHKQIDANSHTRDIGGQEKETCICKPDTCAAGGTDLNVSFMKTGSCGCAAEPCCHYRTEDENSHPDLKTATNHPYSCDLTNCAGNHRLILPINDCVSNKRRQALNAYNLALRDDRARTPATLQYTDSLQADWQRLNDDIFTGDAADFGVALHDIADYNLEQAHDKAAAAAIDADDAGTAHKRILQAVAVLDSELAASASGELRKLRGSAHAPLSTLLAQLGQN